MVFIDILFYFISFGIFSVPVFFLWWIRKGIHSSSSLSWVVGKYPVVVLHLVIVSLMLAITISYGDGIDIGTILIIAPFVFLFHYRHNCFTVGLACFSIYLSLIYSIDRVIGYPLYGGAPPHNYLVFLFILIEKFWIFCIIFNLILNRKKRVFAFSLFSICIFYSQILPFPGVIIRQIKGNYLIDINLIASEYNDVFYKKMVFTKITSKELYMIVEEENRDWSVLYFQREENGVISIPKKIKKFYIYSRKQEINIHNWQRFILSKDIFK
jgi:hypothetical protein